jgi:uncharacterized Tic20 family protein
MSEFVIPGKPESPAAQASQARRWTMICHLSWMLGFVFPFGNMIGPLIVWLAKRREYPEVDAHGREALNFQMSMTFYGVILTLLLILFIFWFRIGWAALAVFIVLLIEVAAAIFLTLIAAQKAENGSLFRYPLAIRFLK